MEDKNPRVAMIVSLFIYIPLPLSSICGPVLFPFKKKTQKYINSENSFVMDSCIFGIPKPKRSLFFVFLNSVERPKIHCVQKCIAEGKKQCFASPHADFCTLTSSKKKKLDPRVPPMHCPSPGAEICTLTSAIPRQTPRISSQKKMPKSGCRNLRPDFGQKKCDIDIAFQGQI